MVVGARGDRLTNRGVFAHVEPFAGDSIFALVDAFNADVRRPKVNLTIGIYLDEHGRVPLLESVRQAEADALADARAKPYQPMEGSAAMRAAVQRLLFGDGHPAVAAGRVATIQSVGSSGGLKTGADFLRAWLPESGVWVSDPTWDNHRSLLEGAGFPVRAYPYYDAASGGLRFDAMREAIAVLPPSSIVLLHACCHNPTGVDLTMAQWDALIPIFSDRRLLPFVDLAYQGYGDGIEEDAYAVRALADAGIAFLVANSFSKSMSIYGERAGALSVVCETAEDAARVLGQLAFTVRRSYSGPPLHAAEIVSRVLADGSLRPLWEGEVARMRERIAAMRRALHDRLAERIPAGDFGFLLRQRGMFSYTGLTPEQVDRLRVEEAVYLLRSGRLCVAALNEGNVDRVADAMAAVLQAPSGYAPP